MRSIPLPRLQRRFGSDDFLWISYLPSMFFEHLLNDSSVMGALFETNNPCMEVQKCGPHQIVPYDEYNIIEELDDNGFKTGWFSIQDNVWRWEKLIPAYEEGGVRLPFWCNVWIRCRAFLAFLE
ncbi:hypothetical protein L3X38_000036 [Prunus dulcis]|uniref:Uncharacterized protein n=1 Tax=Prunus dulcis TaxID=3755 RepID=A0AAD4UQE1_PRUDU|nr:hypothetical protein L3X38_000036 [Prunus dulcis]